MERLGVYVSAICVIGVLSFIWKENPYYSLMEHLFVGLAAGQAVAAAYGVIKNSALVPMASGSLSLIVPVILGLALYLRFFKQYSWLARIPSSLLLGLGLGAGTAAAIASDVVVQTRVTMIPLTSFTNVVLVVGFLTTLSYFFFSFVSGNDKAIGVQTALKYLSIVGRWTMMIFFGAQVGNVTAGRLSMVINKFQFILGDFLGIIKI